MVTKSPTPSNYRDESPIDHPRSGNELPVTSFNSNRKTSLLQFEDKSRFVDSSHSPSQTSPRACELPVLSATLLIETFQKAKGNAEN